MDWPRRPGDLLKRDKDDVFYYEALESTIVRKLETDSECKKWTLSTDDEWFGWFEKEHLLDHGREKPGVGAILAGRAPEDDDDGYSDTGDDDNQNLHLIEHLPFSRDVFDRIAERFFVHGFVARTLQRGHALFAHSPRLISLGQSGPCPATSYVCRASHYWPGDMALSTTYFPKTGFSYGIFYGCDAETRKEIAGRLSYNSGESVSHPVLLPGIFAELERKRHLQIVKSSVARLLRTVAALSRAGSDYRALAPEGDGSNHAIYPWLKMHHLKNGLESWRAQLVKMADHADELSRTVFAAAADAAAAATAEDVNAFAKDEARKEACRRSGRQIQERLLEIIHDYDDSIRECVMIMEGMTLATQLAHTKANMEVAIATSKDSSQMKSIATLTMVFLPATFLATLFSMSFFKWDAAEGESLVSSYLWIYFLVAVPCTAMTLATYYWWSNRQDKKLKGPEAMV